MSSLGLCAARLAVRRPERHRKRGPHRRLPRKDRIERLDQNAVQAALADGVTTGLAMSAGALEINP